MYDITRMTTEDKERVVERLRTEYDIETFADMEWTLSAIAVALNVAHDYYNDLEDDDVNRLTHEQLEVLLNVEHVLNCSAFALSKLY